MSPLRKAMKKLIVPLFISCLFGIGPVNAQDAPARRPASVLQQLPPPPPVLDQQLRKELMSVPAETNPRGSTTSEPASHTKFQLPAAFGTGSTTPSATPRSLKV